MSGLLRLPATRAWLALVAVTLVSFVLAEGDGSPRLVATVVMLIAAFKVHLVVVHFMELRWRPLPWRVLFEGWTVAVTLVIVGGYWLASA